MTSVPFERVVAEHGAMVLSVCRAMLGPIDADDAWSDTFLAALRAYPSLREGSNVAAWLVTIAHRKAIDQTRRRARAPIPVDTATLATPAAPEPPAALDDDLLAALASLSGQQRAAVVYHHIAGLPHAEIAAILDVSPAAARRSASDGIARLRAWHERGRCT